MARRPFGGSGQAVAAIGQGSWRLEDALHFHLTDAQLHEIDRAFPLGRRPRTLPMI
jgi:hypothetical protein